jgi:hypothetical protein
MSREAGEKGYLPPFEIEESYEIVFDEEDIVMLELKCPRCEGIFIVQLDRFVAPLMSVIRPELELKGRCCPYCSKVCEVPEEFVPERWTRSDAPLLVYPPKKIKKTRIKRTKKG